MADAIRIEGLKKWYGSLQALKGITFSIKEGEFFGYLGPNGAGKTTTINSIIGIGVFQEGSIQVMGHDVIKDYRQARRLIGFAPQELGFDPFLNVRDILRIQGRYYGVTKGLNERVDFLLKKFDLWEKRKGAARQLSGGMKRRLQIAKAMVHDPPILILDEPTAGVDVDIRRSFWEYLQEINKEGKTILLTTHYIDEAERLCGRIGIIAGGEIRELDSKAALVERHGMQTFEIVLDGSRKATPALKGLKCRIEQNGRTLKVSCPNATSTLPAVLQRLTKAGIKVKSIDMHKSSLEDIYVRLVNQG